MTDPAYVLMPPELEAEVPNLYAQDGKGDETWVYAKYFLAGFTWWLTEFDKEGKDRCFGLVLNEANYGQYEMDYFSLSEMAGVDMIPGVGKVSVIGKSDRRRGVGVERDLHFTPCCLGYVKARIDQNEDSPYWDRPQGLAHQYPANVAQYCPGHYNQETAFLIEDYPVSRKSRGMKRVWLERIEKGASKGKFRWVYQTTTPKHKWGPNGPKWRSVQRKGPESTGASLIVLYLDKKNGHLKADKYHHEYGGEHGLVQFHDKHLAYFEADPVMEDRWQELMAETEAKILAVQNANGKVVTAKDVKVNGKKIDLDERQPVSQQIKHFWG